MAGRKRKATANINSDLSRKAVKLTPLSLLDVLDTDRYYPIYDHLCSHLSVNSALSLSVVCKQLHQASQQKWSVDTRLLRFVKDPLRLRSELGRHASLISGSFALQFFAQCYWSESDLDLFVEQGDALEALQDYLQQEEQYALHSISDEHSYGMRGLQQIRTYFRPKEVDRSQTKVQLVVTEMQPILAMLQGFYMTAVMNVISWNKAYALFARDTFIDQKTYMLKPVDAYFQRLVRKYRQRGWYLEEIMRKEDHSSNTSIQPLRRLGDRYTWTIALPTENVRQSPHPDSVLECSTFSLGPTRVRGNLRYLVSACQFEHIMLHYRYVRPSPFAWMGFLVERLHSYARLELLASKPANRPAWFNVDGQHGIERLDESRFYAATVVEDFRKVKQWRRFDHEVPRWFEQFYKSMNPSHLDFGDIVDEP